ncbi:MAG: heat-inducible transcriptional repressor HrcA, partial [Nitrospinales bacterium]
LEERGYIQQPHTSAGRVPTDKGYRFYVDHLMDIFKAHHPPAIAKPKRDLQDQTLEDFFENACSVLSKNSNQTGLVMLPSFSNILLKHIEFIKVGKREVLAVFLSEMGILQNKVLRIEKELSQETLSSVAKYFNAEFRGKSIKAIREELLYRIKNEKEHYDQLMKRAVELGSKIFNEENQEGDLIVDGFLNFLNHPEFSDDLEKIKIILKTIEKKTKLIKLLDLCLEQDGMTIIIGQENNDIEMQGCSLVAQSYQFGNEKMGAVAVFGPKRMDYKNVIPVVNQTAKTVSQLLSERNYKGV